MTEFQGHEEVPLKSNGGESVIVAGGLFSPSTEPSLGSLTLSELAELGEGIMATPAVRTLLHKKGLLSSADPAKAVSPTEILTVLKLLCSGMTIVCPIIQGL